MNVERLVEQRRVLEAMYWARPLRWTRSGDVLHKHGVARELRAVEGRLDREANRPVLFIEFRKGGGA